MIAALVGFLLLFAANADAGYMYHVPRASLHLSTLRPQAYTYLRQHQRGQHQRYRINNHPAVYQTVPAITQQQQSYDNVNQLPSNNLPAVYHTTPTITQQQQSYNVNQLPSNSYPAVYHTVRTITHQQQSYNNVNQLPINNHPVVHHTVSAIPQQQEPYNNVNQLPSNDYPAVHHTVSAISQQQEPYNNVNQLPTNNHPAVHHTVSAIPQQQEPYNNFNHLSTNNHPEAHHTVSAIPQQQHPYNNVNQVPSNDHPAAYHTAPVITQQQSCNNVHNYITAQYSNGGSELYSHNSGNVEHFLPVQTTQEQVHDQTSGIHINDEYHTDYATHVSQPTAPVVTKHIYFHVPPADEEHTAPAPVQSVPQKKVYNIVFIKVPAQQTRNNGQLLQVLASQQNRIEDKTLIYVLVKKPEPQPILEVPVTPVKSEHEVFYVKYKGDGSEAAAQVNNQLAHLDSGFSATDNLHSSQLQPGLVNGHV